MEETVEIDMDQFTARYTESIKGNLSQSEEEELLDIAYQCMMAQELDDESRNFFHSSFLFMSKKNKRFIDLRKMNRLMRNERSESTSNL